MVIHPGSPIIYAQRMITSLVYRDYKLAAQNVPVETLPALRAEPGVMLWIDLSAPTEAEVKAVLETLFAFHPLAIEDCLTDSPFPKLELYDDYLYLVMHAIDSSLQTEFRTTELDLFLGKDYLVTYHRAPLHSIGASFEKFTKTSGTLVRGPDRFAHTILDFMVEAYKPTLDSLRSEIERIEESVLGSIDAQDLFPRVVALRKQLSRLRQIVRPQREIALDLATGKHRLIRSVIVPYLRDLSEELARIENQAAVWAEQLILSFRIYLNKSSHEANEGIRVLTGITALTFPLLMIAGWYGMNFESMHELSSRSGYLGAAALTVAGTFATWLFMRRRKWL